MQLDNQSKAEVIILYFIIISCTISYVSFSLSLLLSPLAAIIILNLIYFRPHYLALPAQSVECRLANIVPPGSTWPKRACKILVEMTKDKALYAFVTCTKVRHSL